ncbi:MAG: ATP-binding cassette domain-containing protein, partial [Sphaerochaetaceae bacterium]
SVAVVDQEIKVFEGTLMDNMKLWDNTIDDSVVIQACRDAQIHQEIMLRSGGYSCMVDEGGKNFSGGQLQRFEIARVLALNPSVLILDEATSAVDADTEYLIMQAIRKRNITSIIISHRLSAIRDSDEIIVLDQGRIVERGSHDQLFKSGGLYSRLVTVE